MIKVKRWKEAWGRYKKKNTFKVGKIQEDHEFEVSFGHTVRTYQERKRLGSGGLRL
jgi:hypothetical protein